jgi:hypothetical protein
MRLDRVLGGLVAGVGAVVMAAAPAAARDLPEGGMTAHEIAGWLVDNGYQAQVQPDPTTPGDQIVSTQTDGIKVDIYLYDCSGAGDARRCTSMQYAVGWPPKSGYNLERINSWNRSNRYIKAYLTTKGGLFGEYDLDLSPGGSFEMLSDSLQNWRSVVVDFDKYFND